MPIKEITKRMLELEKEHGQLDTSVSFVIAREIAEEKFYKFERKADIVKADDSIVKYDNWIATRNEKYKQEIKISM